jgi:transcriptional regulator with XRE-family HTH domain
MNYDIFENLLKINKTTVYRVSKETGISASTLSDWKSGRSVPKLDKMRLIAEFFGVSLEYLRGESDDPTTMDSWLNGNVPDDAPPSPPPVARPRIVQSSGGNDDGGAVFSALLKSKSFQTLVHDTILDVLRSPEGQELLAKAIRKDLGRK